MRKLLFLLFQLLISMKLFAQTTEYGLHIQSYPLQGSEHTSISLEDGRSIDTKGEEMSLDFSLWLRNDNVFGTVFRIITNEGKNIDLMYSVGENDRRFPILVTGDAVHPILKEARRETWVPVSLRFRPSDGEVALAYDSTKVEVNFPELKGTTGIRIAFGLCPFVGYSLADVASANLKDIRITRGSKEIRLWKMERHAGDNCYDELIQSPATGKNTHWIIDQYITWKHIYMQNFPSPPSVAFDPNGTVFYIAADSKKLFLFRPGSSHADTLRVKGGEFAANFPNQMIFIPQKDQLLSYNLNENLYSAFNCETMCWEGQTAPSKEHDYWNNTITYNPTNESLVSFGGYGHYHYNNELLISYPWSDQPQRRTNLTNIHPRYTSSSVIVDSTLYIFGGRGCPSGRQELSPRNYYDLYSVNLLTQQVNKLWEYEGTPPEGDFQPGENMVYDRENKCFYFISTQQHGVLMRMNTKEADFEPMSLPIGVSLDAQYMFCNLYESPVQKKLYAVFLHSDVGGKSSIDIYTLNYPPVSVKEMEQKIALPKGEEGMTGWVLWTIIGIAVLFFAGAGYYYMRRRKAASNANFGLPVGREPYGATREASEVSIQGEEPVLNNYDFSRQCVCLFGGFRTIDRNGNDITGQFTPTLKALLMLLILYTGKDPKGIIGRKMIQLLWFDKSEESGKNNRNVYMSKLRTLLEKVGDIRIQNQNGFWNIQFEDGTVCDYLEALKLFREGNSQNLDKLLELLLRGIMLPNMETDWIDTFKNDFSNTTIDLLSRLLKREDISDVLKLKIADTLFQHDYINEEALCVKCNILCKQGKKGLAKIVYDAFCKEYQASMGAEYKYSLMEVIAREL